MKKFYLCKLCLIVFGALLLCRRLSQKRLAKQKVIDLGFPTQKSGLMGTFHDASSGRDLPMDKL